MRDEDANAPLDGLIAEIYVDVHWEKGIICQIMPAFVCCVFEGGWGRGGEGRYYMGLFFSCCMFFAPSLCDTTVVV